MKLSYQDEEKIINSELFNKLRNWRRETAIREGVKPYIIFSDATLIELCNKLPKTQKELLEIRGMGEKKFNKYGEEILENGEEREVLHLLPALAPYKLTILPLIKKVHAYKAKEIFSTLCSEFPVTYDETGSIGKRYRRSDAIGTPFAVTIDDESLENGTVTVRERDTMEQVKIKISELKDYINERIKL